MRKSLTETKMSTENYSHWADKNMSVSLRLLVMLAEAEVQIIKKKYLDKRNIADVGTVSKEQFDECNKEIKAVYDKFKIQVDREMRKSLTKTKMSDKKICWFCSSTLIDNKDRRNCPKCLWEEHVYKEITESDFDNYIKETNKILNQNKDERQ